MIDLHINREGLDHNIQNARENGIIIPTIAQMRHPETSPFSTVLPCRNIAKLPYMARKLRHVG